MSEVDDIIQDLKKNAGFHSYLILNNDGIVIKYENMSLKTALHFSYHVLGLTQRATSALRTLLQPPDVSSLNIHKFFKCSYSIPIIIIICIIIFIDRMNWKHYVYEQMNMNSL